MKKIILFILLILAPVEAFSKDTYVRGYTRKDGTYVAPHYRTSPNSTTSDNYSTEGNINPYTGKVGDKPDTKPSSTFYPTPPLSTYQNNYSNQEPINYSELTTAFKNVYVISGDKIKVNNRIIKLKNIQSYEANQKCGNYNCGLMAKQFLVKLIKSASNLDLVDYYSNTSFRCVDLEFDSNNTLVGNCSVNALSLNAGMVLFGYAFPLNSAYSLEFDDAKQFNKGLLGFTKIMPWEYKNAQLGITSENCSIKGNINSKGKKLYHIAGSNNYDMIKPEAVFCSVEEAIVAGYSPPKK